MTLIIAYLSVKFLSIIAFLSLLPFCLRADMLKGRCFQAGRNLNLIKYQTSEAFGWCNYVLIMFDFLTVFYND